MLGLCLPLPYHVTSILDLPILNQIRESGGGGRFLKVFITGYAQLSHCHSHQITNNHILSSHKNEEVEILSDCRYQEALH